MRLFKNIFLSILLFAGSLATRAQTVVVDHFDKVIISPFIQVIFEQGETECVRLNEMLVDSSKLHVEVRGGTLRMYLEGAKDIPPYEKSSGRSRVYPKHAVVATVVYKALKTLSLRGEETHLCQSPLVAKKFTLRVYGESTVVFTEMHVRKLHTVMYGESSVEVRSGSADEQRFTCYGEGKINTTAITGRDGKVTAFGRSTFSMNVSDRIKVTAIGDAKLCYMGNPYIVKGIHIGDLNLVKID